MSEPRPSTSEYHDPDYPEAAPSLAREKLTSPSKKIEKIITIVKKEFNTEIQNREQELDNIDQRLTYARRSLHRLRYAIVNSYYQNSRLQPTESEVQDEVKTQQDIKASNEALAILRNEQKRLHPSLRKLLGKKEVDLGQLITYQPRPRQRKDYSAMTQTGLNTTIAEDKQQKNLRTSTPIKDESASAEKALKRLQETSPSKAACDPKVPRYVAPKGLDSKVVKINEASRNKKKVKYRILVGNTSRFIPPSSAVDRSTHRWLLYIRGPKNDPDVSHFISTVVVELHESYQPHHIVHLNRAPFHLTRRGWGEFPVKLEIRFANPVMNRPINVVHNLKLDRKYTGLQTLGSETMVDVWLYADETMRKPIESTAELNSNFEDGQTDSSCQNSDSESVGVALTKDLIKQEINGLHNSTVCMKQETPPINIKEEIIDVPMDVVDDYDDEPVEEYNVRVKEEVSENSNYDLPPQISKDKKIIKCIDKNTGRILFLELDPDLPLEKMNEIIINHVRDKNNFVTATTIPPKQATLTKKNGVNSNCMNRTSGQTVKKGESLLKNNQVNTIHHFPHLANDHCYVKRQNSFAAHPEQMYSANAYPASFPKDVIEDLSCRMARIEDVRCAVNFLLRNMPIVTQFANSEAYVAQLPFAVPSSQKFHQYHLAKRRSMEWSRAKLIRTLLEVQYPVKYLTLKNWTTRQILVYARLHGFGVPTPGCEARDGVPFDLKHISKGVFKSASDVCTLSQFDSNEMIFSKIFNIKSEGVKERQDLAESYRVKSIDISDSSSEEDIDVSNFSYAPIRNWKQSPHKNRSSDYNVMPVEDENERLQCLFIERKCAEVGVELRNEFVGHGQVHCLAHRTILTALKLFTEELLRLSLAQKLRKDLVNVGDTEEERIADTRPPVWSDTRIACESQCIEIQDIFEVISQRSRFNFLTNSGLGAEEIKYDENL